MMVAGLLLIVFAILLAGRILVDRQHDLRRWFYYYEQQKITTPYPESIQSWESIPPAYQDIFLPTDALPYMLFIPGSRSILRKRSAKLVVLEPQGLVVYEESSTAKHEFPFDEILAIEHEKMLSAFWFTLICRHKATTIPYLSKDDGGFAAIIKNLRIRFRQRIPSAFESAETIRSKTQHDFPHGADTFGRIANAQCLPGQHVIMACFQPAYQAQENRYGGLVRKTITYARHLSVLTDSEVMIVQESEPIRTSTYNQYARKEVFIPYGSIQQVQVSEEVTARKLTLSLQGTQTVSLYFAYANEAFPAFCENLTRLVATPREPAIQRQYRPQTRRAGRDG